MDDGLPENSLPRPQRLKIASAYWLPIITWVFMAFLIVEPMFMGRWDVVAKFGPGMALAAWLIYLAMWAPFLEVYPDRAVIRNVVATYSLPYERITDIQIGSSVTISYKSPSGEELEVSSWNAPGVPKLGRLKKAKKDPSGPSQVLVDKWQAHFERPRKERDRTTSVTKRWHLVEGAITLVLLLLVVTFAVI